MSYVFFGDDSVRTMVWTIMHNSCIMNLNILYGSDKPWQTQTFPNYWDHKPSPTFPDLQGGNPSDGLLKPTNYNA